MKITQTISIVTKILQHAHIVSKYPMMPYAYCFSRILDAYLALTHYL